MSKYFIARVKYTEPVPGKDTVKKISKSFLVRAESVTEVEVKVQNWWPANWNEPEVKAVTPSPIEDITQDGDSETWWQFKIMHENPENGKFSAAYVAANGGVIENILAKTIKANPMGEVWEVKKLKIEFDTDLTKE